MIIEPKLHASVLRASDVMTYPVVAATPRTTVRDLASQMILGGFSGMPVAERNGSILGVVTEFDVLRAIREEVPLETTTADQIMTREVITVDVDDPVGQVMEILQTAHVLRIPVTRRGRLAGIISRPDLLRSLVEPNFIDFAQALPEDPPDGEAVR